MYRTIQEYAHMKWLFGSDFMGGMIDGKEGGVQEGSVVFTTLPTFSYAWNHRN